MKNVFIEGIQGMGKSTLINGIYEKVPEFHICREGDYSPIDLAWCTWMSQDDYDTVLKKYTPIQDEIKKNTIQEKGHFIVAYTKIITDIPNFHKDMETYEVYNGRKTFNDFKEIVFSRYQSFSETGYLFECSFFQNLIENLLLFYLLEDDEIVDFYRDLYGCLKKEQFLLLYLYSDKVEDVIKTIRKERCDLLGNELWYQMMLAFFIHSPYGEKYGCSTFEDLIAHFRRRQRLELYIIRKMIGGNAVILPAKEWKMDAILPLIEVKIRM